MLAQVQVVGLQLVQPLIQALCRLEGLDHRQGVDEQAKHVLRVGQALGATGHRSAEATLRWPV